jgi:metallophosphoesterase (TIGR00282 family)
MLRDFKTEQRIDFTIANIENAAGGFGVTEQIARKVFSYGVDVLTSGNHIWDRQEIREYIAIEPALLRPANYPAGAPGNGYYVATLLDGRRVAVLNLQGRVSMPNIDCPFRTADGALSLISRETPIVFIDLHAEATSEKKAMAIYLDGRISALVGTHTHVQTADEQILPNGTAFLAAIKRFLHGMPYRFSCASDDIRMQGAVVEVDDKTGLATSIERYSLKAPAGAQPSGDS